MGTDLLLGSQLKSPRNNSLNASGDNTLTQCLGSILEIQGITADFQQPCQILCFPHLKFHIYSTLAIKKDKEAYSCWWNSISQLRDVTCYMGSHSVTCHPTQVNAPRLHPSQ